MYKKLRAKTIQRAWPCWVHMEDTYKQPQIPYKLSIAFFATRTVPDCLSCRKGPDVRTAKGKRTLCPTVQSIVAVLGKREETIQLARNASSLDVSPRQESFLG